MVVLSNESSEHGVVCADAVRFGGGMGNISRGGKISGLPVIWKEHDIHPSGPVCHTMYMPGVKEKTIIQTISIHVPIQSTICREALSIIRDKRV